MATKSTNIVKTSFLSDKDTSDKLLAVGAKLGGSIQETIVSAVEWYITSVEKRRKVDLSKTPKADKKGSKAAKSNTKDNGAKNKKGKKGK